MGKARRGMSARDTAPKGKGARNTDAAAEAGGFTVFTGPAVEGGREKYVKIVSGKITPKKPSFAR